MTGLPELPRPSLPADEGSAIQRTHGYTADQMREYGELCRRVVIDGAMVRRAMKAEFCGRSMRNALMMGTHFDHEILEAALRAAFEATQP